MYNITRREAEDIRARAPATVIVTTGRSKSKGRRRRRYAEETDRVTELLLEVRG